MFFQLEICKVLLWSEATRVQSMHTMIDHVSPIKDIIHIVSFLPLKLGIYTLSIQ